MNANQCREHLSGLLQAQVERITQANQYLLVIKNALADDRLEDLLHSLTNPDLTIEDIENLEQQRYQLLADYGFDQNPEGLEKCINWCDDRQRLAGIYQQLVDSLVSLRHSIQINSLLVNKGQERIRRSIGILTGVGTAGACKTYGDKGQAITPADRRGIAIA